MAAQQNNISDMEHTSKASTDLDITFSDASSVSGLEIVKGAAGSSKDVDSSFVDIDSLDSEAELAVIDNRIADDDNSAYDRSLQHYLDIFSLVDSDDDDDEDNEIDEEIMRSLRFIEPLYPQQVSRNLECEICLDTSFFPSRPCCRFKVCDECLKTYITLKVTDGIVHIECPNDSGRCQGHIHRNEIRDRLSDDMREKYDRFLVDANADPSQKTCPSCSKIYTVDKELLKSDSKTLKKGLKVICSHCELEWCFLCQAPFHTDITCKEFRKGDLVLRKWAKEVCKGKANAQRCPKCKTYIQKSDGCDHMKCTQCQTDFCYRCGERYLKLKLVGNHFSRFSMLGCKYRFMPDKPVLRRLIRGSSFGKYVKSYFSYVKT